MQRSTGFFRAAGPGSRVSARPPWPVFLKQPGMRVDTLFTIYQVLNHNFLREIADQLPADMPPQQPPASRPAANTGSHAVEHLKAQLDKLTDALVKK